jgi:cell division protease FtsH
MGSQPDYSFEVAHEIDEEVRALIEAAHNEAYEVLTTYRDVLDDLVRELLDKETLPRKDLERIFAQVEKRPRITAFNDFGDRIPSEKPPIKTRAELARERGEPVPLDKDEKQVAADNATSGNHNGAKRHDWPGEVAGGNGNGGPDASRGTSEPREGSGEQPAGSGPPNYGAPSWWRPATSPGGSSENGWPSNAERYDRGGSEHSRDDPNRRDENR